MLKFKPAFTLIELIIVMVIITVLAVAGVFIPLHSNKLIAAANKLMFDLRYAQQLAISRQVPCGISFDVSAESYFVFINDTSSKAKNPYTGEDFIINYNAVSELKGIGLASTNFGNVISFNYLGVPHNSSNTTLSSVGIITLQYGGRSKNVVMEPDTGQVKIQ
jgi:prepilin-type N-terminal cleavage/methylation domain-containing protein